MNSSTVQNACMSEYYEAFATRRKRWYWWHPLRVEGMLYDAACYRILAACETSDCAFSTSKRIVASMSRSCPCAGKKKRIKTFFKRYVWTLNLCVLLRGLEAVLQIFDLFLQNPVIANWENDQSDHATIRLQVIELTVNRDLTCLPICILNHHCSP